MKFWHGIVYHGLILKAKFGRLAKGGGWVREAPNSKFGQNCRFPAVAVPQNEV